MRRTLIAVFALPLLAGCINVQSERQTTTVRRNWSAAEVRRLEITGVNGRMDLRAGEGDVTMAATIQSRRREDDPSKALDISLSGGTLRIEERHGHERGWFHLFGNDDRSIDYEITLPASVEVDATNVNGKLRLDGVAARATLNSVNGSVEVRKPSGELEVQTVNGRVSAEFLQSFAGAKLRTVNGSIEVVLPSQASYTYEVSQVNGSFRSNLPMRSSSTTFGASEAGGSVNGGRYRLDLTTVNGSVAIEQKEAVALGAPAKQ